MPMLPVALVSPWAALFCIAPPLVSPGCVPLVELPLFGDVAGAFVCANAPVLHSKTVDNARAVSFIRSPRTTLSTMEGKPDALSRT